MRATRPGAWALMAALGLTACRMAGVAPAPVPEPVPAAGPGAAPALDVDSAAVADTLAPAPAGSALPAEVRALWVVRTTLTSPERIQVMVRDAQAAGFNTLLVQVRGRGDAYYRSTLEPRAAPLAGAPADFDPLATVLAEARPRGLAVHAWVNANLVWGVGPLPDDASHLVRARPDLLAVPRGLAPELAGLSPFDARYLERLHGWTVERRDRLEGLYTDPAHPAARARVVEVVEELVRTYPLDGVHLDYVRYASPDFGYAPGAPDPPDGPAAFAARRRGAVTALVRGVRTRLRALAPQVLLSAAVFPDAAEAAATRFQDWASWLRDDLVDVVVPMAYTADQGRFGELARGAVAADAQNGRRVWMGVGAYMAGFEPSLGQVEAARAAGSGGVALFSYDWAAEVAPAVDGTPWLTALGARAFPTTPARAPGA